MKLFLSVILFSISLIAAPQKYKISMTIMEEGKIISTPVIIVEEGKLGLVQTTSDKGTQEVQVIANNAETQGKKGVLMKFNIKHTKPNGYFTTVSKPEILALPNQEAVLTVNNNNTEQTHLSVVVTKL